MVVDTGTLLVFRCHHRFLQHRQWILVFQILRDLGFSTDKELKANIGF